MRIRKYAKLHNLPLHPDMPHPVPPLQCPLNQSPWDVIDFPPNDAHSSTTSYLQYFKSGEDFSNFGENRSFDESTGSVESAESETEFTDDEEVSEEEEWILSDGTDLDCESMEGLSKDEKKKVDGEEKEMRGSNLKNPAIFVSGRKKFKRAGSEPAGRRSSYPTPRKCSSAGKGKSSSSSEEESWPKYATVRMNAIHGPPMDDDDDDAEQGQGQREGEGEKKQDE